MYTEQEKKLIKQRTEILCSDCKDSSKYKLIEKKVKIEFLYMWCSDYIVNQFFDLDSDEMLDEKIEVLEKLKSGIPSGDIPNYYKILENYPKEGKHWN